MSRQVESSHDGLNQEVSLREGAQSREESAREGSGRSVTGRVVSAVGAVLKRPHSQVNFEPFLFYLVVHLSFQQKTNRK